MNEWGNNVPKSEGVNRILVVCKNQRLSELAKNGKAISVPYHNPFLFCRQRNMKVSEGEKFKKQGENQSDCDDKQ